MMNYSPSKEKNCDLENLTVNGVQEMLKKFMFNEEERKMFKDEMVDGYSLLLMKSVPPFIKPHGTKLKFVEMMKSLIGLNLEEKCHSVVKSLNPTIDSTFCSTPIKSHKNKENHIKIDDPEYSTESIDTSLDSSCDDTTTNNDTDKDYQNIINVTDLPLPEFSDSIEEDLKIGDCWTCQDRRSKFINQLTTHYICSGVDINRRSMYKAISIMLLSKYPKLRDIVTNVAKNMNLKKLRENQGKKKLGEKQGAKAKRFRSHQPWDVISKTLSKKMRNFRRPKKAVDSINFCVNNASLLNSNEKPKLKKQFAFVANNQSPKLGVFSKLTLGQSHDDKLISTNSDNPLKRAYSISTQSPKQARKSLYSAINVDFEAIETDNSKLVKDKQYDKAYVSNKSTKISSILDESDLDEVIEQIKNVENQSQVIKNHQNSKSNKVIDSLNQDQMLQVQHQRNNTANKHLNVEDSQYDKVYLECASNKSTRIVNRSLILDESVLNEVIQQTKNVENSSLVVKKHQNSKSDKVIDSLNQDQTVQVQHQQSNTANKHLNQSKKANESDTKQSKAIQFEFHKQLIECYTKNVDRENINLLIRESFDYRREIFDKNDFTFYELKDKFPYLEDFKIACFEFSLIEKIKLTLNEIKIKIKAILISLWRTFKIKAKDQFAGDLESVRRAEKQIKTSVKFESIISDDKNNSIDAPRIMKNGNNLSIIFRTTALLVLEEQSLVDAMAYMFIFYFVYDLQYPLCLRQILGFFHELLEFNEIVKVSRNDGYAALISSINLKTNKC